MFEKIKALLTKLGINIGDKEAEIKAEIEKLETDANGIIDLSKIDMSKMTNDNPLFKTLIEQNQALIQQTKDLTAALGKETQERENAVKAASEKAKAEQDKKIDDTIKKALQDKKIVEADKEVWKNRLEKDYNEWNKELEAKPLPKQFQGKDTKPVITGESDKDISKSSLKGLTEAIRSEMENNQSKV